MRICKTIKEIRDFRESINTSKDISLGFVPTMGALHKGHKSLIARSISENTHTIVSIFVNPAQFGPNEDLSTYPRTIDEDIKLCENLGVSAVFIPQDKEIYPNIDEVKILAPENMAFILEGFVRPSHFNGVLRILLKLFNLIAPHNAYFGKKDAQQLLVILRMVRDLMLPINICACEIVRDDDGLAFSSRNVYLSKKHRQSALAIPAAINEINKAYKNGEDNVKNLISLGFNLLRDLEVDYLCACDRNLDKIERVRKNDSLILLAARVGGVRLLDNVWF